VAYAEIAGKFGTTDGWRGHGGSEPVYARGKHLTAEVAERGR
jgi:hypothetical protein